MLLRKFIGRGLIGIFLPSVELRNDQKCGIHSLLKDNEKRVRTRSSAIVGSSKTAVDLNVTDDYQKLMEPQIKGEISFGNLDGIDLKQFLHREGFYGLEYFLSIWQFTILRISSEEMETMLKEYETEMTMLKAKAETPIYIISALSIRGAVIFGRDYDEVADDVETVTTCCENIADEDVLQILHDILYLKLRLFSFVELPQVLTNAIKSFMTRIEERGKQWDSLSRLALHYVASLCREIAPRDIYFATLNDLRQSKYLVLIAEQDSFERRAALTIMCAIFARRLPLDENEPQILSQAVEMSLQRRRDEHQVINLNPLDLAKLYEALYFGRNLNYRCLFFSIDTMRNIIERIKQGDTKAEKEAMAISTWIDLNAEEKNVIVSCFGDMSFIFNISTLIALGRGRITSETARNRLGQILFSDEGKLNSDIDLSKVDFNEVTSMLLPLHYGEMVLNLYTEQFSKYISFSNDHYILSSLMFEIIKFISSANREKIDICNVTEIVVRIAERLAKIADSKSSIVNLTYSLQIQVLCHVLYVHKAVLNSDLFSKEQKETLYSQFARYAEMFGKSLLGALRFPIISVRRSILLQLPLSEELREQLALEFLQGALGPTSGVQLFSVILPFCTSKNMSLVVKISALLSRLHIPEDSVLSVFRSPQHILTLIKDIAQVIHIYTERSTDKDVEQFVVSKWLGFFASYVDQLYAEDKKSEIFLPSDIVGFKESTAIIDCFGFESRPKIYPWVVEEALSVCFQVKASLPSRLTGYLRSFVEIFLSPSVSTEKRKQTIQEMLNQFPKDVPARLTNHFVSAIRMRILPSSHISADIVELMVDSSLSTGLPFLLLALMQANAETCVVFERAATTCTSETCALLLRVWGTSMSKMTGSRIVISEPSSERLREALTSVAKLCDTGTCLQLLRHQHLLAPLPRSAVRELWGRVEKTCITCVPTAESDKCKLISPDCLITIAMKIPETAEEIWAILSKTEINISELVSTQRHKVPFFLIDKAVEQCRNIVMSLKKAADLKEGFGATLCPPMIIRLFLFFSNNYVISSKEKHISEQTTQRLENLLQLLNLVPASSIRSADLDEMLFMIAKMFSIFKDNKQITSSIAEILPKFVKIESNSVGSIGKSLSTVPPLLRPLLMSICLEEAAIALLRQNCTTPDLNPLIDTLHMLERYNCLTPTLQRVIVQILMHQIKEWRGKGTPMLRGTDVMLSSAVDMNDSFGDRCSEGDDTKTSELPSPLLSPRSESNVNMRSAVCPYEVGIDILAHIIRQNSFEAEAVTELTTGLIENIPEDNRVQLLMTLLRCFYDVPTVYPQHELVIRAILEDDSLFLSASEFSRMCVAMSRMNSLFTYREQILELLERTFACADPHSQTVILRAISYDEFLMKKSLYLLIHVAETSMDALSGDDIEGLASALINVRPHVEYKDVAAVVVKMIRRVTSVAKSAKKPSLVRVLQLLTDYKLQDIGVLDVIYSSLEEKMPRMPPSYFMTILKSMVELEVPPREKLIMLVVKKMEQLLETMNVNYAVQLLKLLVDLNVTYLPITNGLFLRIYEHKEVVGQNSDLLKLMEEASEVYFIETPQHITRYFLKKKKEKCRIKVLIEKNLKQKSAKEEELKN